MLKTKQNKTKANDSVDIQKTFLMLHYKNGLKSVTVYETMPEEMTGRNGFWKLLVADSADIDNDDNLIKTY